MNGLRALQWGYTISGRLGEALAVRAGVIEFKHRMAGVLPDPGNLTSYREHVGRSYLFSVVGNTSAASLSIGNLGLLRQIGVTTTNDAGTANTVTDEFLGVVARERTTPEELSGEIVSGRVDALHDSSVAFALSDGLTTSPATIWGNDIYTDDSPLSAVAVHAGVLSEGQKGVVRVTIFAGRDDYEGSSRNGVTSSSYGPWGGSYMVEKAPDFEDTKPAKLPTDARTLVAELGAPQFAEAGLFRVTMDGLRKLRTAAERAGKLYDALVLRDAAAWITARRVGASSDPGNATSYRGQNGTRFCFQVTGRTNGSIWGSDTYTDDSDMGTAAVHAGLLRPGQVGIVQVTIVRGLSAYTGTRRNGIASSSYGEWTGSYRLSLVTAF